jgi:hypothetical protein
VVTILAGNGREGHTDGAAAKARFSLNRGIAFDPHDGGSIVVADTFGFIRRIANNGFVTTHPEMWHANAIAINHHQVRMIYARYGAIHDTLCCESGQLPLLPEIPDDMKWNGVSLVHFSIDGRLEGKLAPALANGATFAATFRPPPMASSVGTAIRGNFQKTFEHKQHVVSVAAVVGWGFVGLVLKTIFNTDRDDRETRERKFRYEREWALAGALGQSAHIVPVYHSFESEISPALALPDVDEAEIGHRALFAVTPYFPFTLQQLLAHRLTSRPSLSSPNNGSPASSTPNGSTTGRSSLSSVRKSSSAETKLEISTRADTTTSDTTTKAAATTTSKNNNGESAPSSASSTPPHSSESSPKALSSTSTTPSPTSTIAERLEIIVSQQQNDSPPNPAAAATVSAATIPPVRDTMVSPPFFGAIASPEPVSSTEGLSLSPAAASAALSFVALTSSTSPSPFSPATAAVTTAGTPVTSPGIIPSAATRRLSTAVELPVLLTNQEVVHLGYQLAVGLHHLHHRSIAHR